MAIKIGAEDKKKVAIAGALGLAVLLLAARTIFGGPDTPAPPAPVLVAPPSPLRAAAGSSIAAEPRRMSSAAQLDPTLHPELMAENEAFLYNGSGRNIFSANSVAPAMPIERVKAPIRPTIQVAQAPAGPPPPPAIDLRFFGFAARGDGSRKAFLLHGEDVFIAAEGDVVSHRYRVVRIAPTSIMVEDLPYHNTQSLPLVQN